MGEKIDIRVDGWVGFAQPKDEPGLAYVEIFSQHLMDAIRYLASLQAVDNDLGEFDTVYTVVEYEFETIVVP